MGPKESVAPGSAAPHYRIDAPVTGQDDRTWLMPTAVVVLKAKAGKPEETPLAGR